MNLIIAVTLFLCAFNFERIRGDDLYKLLDVPRDATVKEIRRAFKNLAIKLHPDKNPDDEEADEKFIKITRAYEILKDPETRKTYDLHGDADMMNDSKPSYHSYSYYTDQFGIYDDDPLIVTLSKADYEVNVLDNSKSWFINFYSPQCHHCHTLAPAWRTLAAEMEGVVRIGAVNCEEDWVLCHQLNIDAYPTLLFYEKEAHLYEGEHYRGSKQLEDLMDFILSRLTVSEQYITRELWPDIRNKQWLLFLCPDDGVVCPEETTRIKITATLEGLMPVGFIADSKLCGEIYENHKQDAIVYWKYEKESDAESTVLAIGGSDTKEIIDQLLDLLPNPELLNEERFREIRTALREGTSNPWLICFYMGTATELNLQLKRLPTMITNTNIGLVHCGKNAGLCGSLHISHYPTWGVLKSGGAFELHHGRDVLHEIASFARDSVKSTNLHALSPADFKHIKNDDKLWFIDWYAPWCPPCRRLMPEMRKASQHFDADVIQFGTIDCTLHTKLCGEEGIRSYPTTVFYNGSAVRHHYHGVQNEDGIVEFVEDMLHPSVITLDSSNFVQLMRKPEKELWVVDFYAPWCGPCQRLAPEWRKLAKQLKRLENVKVAQVDCVANAELCNAQNVRSYPTIRLYPLGSKGMNTVAMFNGHREVMNLKSWVYTFLPSSVKSLTAELFQEKIMQRTPSLPWLVDFYAPWCGHCVDFEPEFRTVSDALQGKVHSAKLDCDAERNFCRQLRIVSYPTVVLYKSANDFYQINSQDSDEIVAKVTEILETRRYVHDEF